MRQLGTGQPNEANASARADATRLQTGESLAPVADCPCEGVRDRVRDVCYPQSRGVRFSPGTRGAQHADAAADARRQERHLRQWSGEQREQREHNPPRALLSIHNGHPGTENESGGTWCCVGSERVLS